MKKRVLLLFLAIITLSITSWSQDEPVKLPDTAYYYLGVGGSLNNVWIINQNMYGQPEIDYALKVGGGVMLAAGYNFNDLFGLRIEPSYSWQGQKYEGDQTIDGTTYNTTRNIKLEYFQMPIFFRYSPGTGDTRFHLMVGPGFAALLSAEQEYLRDGAAPDPFYSWSAARQIDPGEEDITDRFNTIDILSVVDLGCDVKLCESWFINIGLRFTYGLTDINAEEWQIENMDGEYKASRNFTAGLNVGFNWMQKK